MPEKDEELRAAIKRYFDAFDALEPIEDPPGFFTYPPSNANNAVYEARKKIEQLLI
jgi:hypothetical protein